MADILLDNQVAPTTPASGKSVLWVDSTTKIFVQTNDTGRHTGDFSRNDATASQTPAAATDTYVTNSGLLIPSFGMKAGMAFKWIIAVSKTAASTAALVLTVRIGTGQSTSDTSRLALTASVAQTAAAADGVMTVLVGVRSVSASGVIAGGFGIAGAVGLGGGATGASSTFDNSALQGNYVGLSINTGTSGAWTLFHVASELVG